LFATNFIQSFNVEYQPKQKGLLFHGLINVTFQGKTSTQIFSETLVQSMYRHDPYLQEILAILFVVKALLQNVGFKNECIIQLQNRKLQ